MDGLFGDESCICLIAKRGVAISGYPGLKDVQDSSL